MIFGEIIIKLRQYLLFDLADHYGEIDGFPSKFAIGIILRIRDLNFCRFTLSQASNCLFKLWQRLSPTDLQKIVLSFSSLKWLTRKGAFKIQSYKISLLHH